MSERVIYTPEAAEDVSDSYDWYERREPGLGEQFLLSVQAGVSRIQRHPLGYPPVLDEFRRTILKRFPFEIFMKQPQMRSSSTRYFISPEIRSDGERG